MNAGLSVRPSIGWAVVFLYKQALVLRVSQRRDEMTAGVGNEGRPSTYKQSFLRRPIKAIESVDS